MGFSLMRPVLVRYVLKAAARDRLVLSLLAAFIVASSLSMFMGSSAVVEKNIFALVFMGAGLRMAGVVGLILFVVFFVRRSFDARDVEFLLSRPVTRAQFLLSFAVGFWILAILTALVQGFAVGILTPGFVSAGSLLWTASLAIENIMIVSVAFFFSLILTSAATAAMASFGFYVLGRMMGEILGIMAAGGLGSWLVLPSHVMTMISMLIPRLDLLGQTSWLVYGTAGSVGYGFLIAQGLVFTALILTAAMIDLVRRKF